MDEFDHCVDPLHPSPVIAESPRESHSDKDKSRDFAPQTHPSRDGVVESDSSESSILFFSSTDLSSMPELNLSISELNGTEDHHVRGGLASAVKNERLALYSVPFQILLSSLFFSHLLKYSTLTFFFLYISLQTLHITPEPPPLRVPLI